MSTIRLVLFDVDGVLLDSLVPHLKFCEDKSREFGLGLRIPTPTELKIMVNRGVQISPMEFLLMAVGFPEKFAEKANAAYKHDRFFMQKYAPAPFSQVDQMLSDLRRSGVRMGIVTSNVRDNFVESLGQTMKYFDPGLIFSKDAVGGMSKAEAIIAAMTRAQVKPCETLYVGDQFSDMEAAKAANANFLGVAYGWGISAENRVCPTVRDVPDVGHYILSLLSQKSDAG